MAKSSKKESLPLVKSILEAIKEGIPLCNAGKRLECYELYKATALVCLSSRKRRGRSVSDDDNDNDGLDEKICTLLNEAVADSGVHASRGQYGRAVGDLRLAFNAVLELTGTKVPGGIRGNAVRGFKSSPDGNAERRRAKELVELCKTMDEVLDIRTHRYLLKNYPDTFVGKDAVTTLVESKKCPRCVDRQSAVDEVNMLLNVGLVHHVTRDHVFRDKELFYHMTDPIDIVVKLGSFGSDADDLRGMELIRYLSLRGRCGLDGDDDPEEGYKASAKESLDEDEIVHSSGNFRDDVKSFDGITEKRRAMQLLKLITTMAHTLDIRVNRFLLVNYPNSFVGDEAVTRLVKDESCPTCVDRQSTEEEVGVLLKYGLLYHVTHDHGFRDKPYVYQLARSSEVKSKLDELGDKEAVANLRGGELVRYHLLRGQYETYHLKPSCLECHAAVLEHKALATKMEREGDCDAAVYHRTQASKHLDKLGNTLGVCRQQLRIAYLMGGQELYTKSAAALVDAIGRLRKAEPAKLDDDKEKRAEWQRLLAQSHWMLAVCYTRARKWNSALEQYDACLKLAYTVRCLRQYNTALIHKSVLLVTMKNYRLALYNIDKYLKNVTFSRKLDGGIIVDDDDHVAALDTAAAAYLNLDNVDKAISIFEEKLEFIENLPDNEERKNDTMHNLGCLLANKDRTEEAMQLLNKALSSKRSAYGGKHRSVLETTWAVAATNHILGDNDKALTDYLVLLDDMTKVPDVRLNATVVHSAAGKLYFECGEVDKSIQSFRQALRGADTSGNQQLKSSIALNLANALLTKGEGNEAMLLYNKLLRNKSPEPTMIPFLAQFNKILLLIRAGEVEEARKILREMEENNSTPAFNDAGKIYLTLGNLAVLDGDVDEALEYFEKSLDAIEDGDLSALAQTKMSIAMAQFEAGQVEEAVSTLEDALEILSRPGVEERSVNLRKAEIWNCLARVYKEKGDLPQVKKFSKLALHTYRTVLGRTNPITLRNVSNLQVLLLEEAEELNKSEAKPIIDAAKYEMEGALKGFASLNDPSTYRLDLASLRINLGFVAVWKEKPKKARDWLDQVRGMELPPEHSLTQRVAVLEECVKELESRSWSRRLRNKLAKAFERQLLTREI